jgi:hypothetical protein
MNLKHLADALDHWKGSIFEGLQRAKLLRNFMIDGMLSDGERWDPQDHRLYERLLRISANQRVTHKNPLSAGRRGYFEEIPADRDLFLDPDTGFRTGRVDNPLQYLDPAEFLYLLGKSGDRIMIVYQHVRGEGTRDRISKVLRAIQDTRHHARVRFSCASYESSMVALLFFSQSSGRVEAIGDHFRRLLHGHAARRVGRWNGHCGRLAQAKGEGARPAGDAEGKTARMTGKCPCCGEETGSYFRMGHDGKIKGWFKKVDDGRMATGDLPTKETRAMYDAHRKHPGMSLRELAAKISEQARQGKECGT